MNLNTHLGRFRLVALLEGVSFLLLLFVAMPMKYMGDNPVLIRPLGMAHGILFVAYLLLLVVVKEDQKWSFGLLVKSALASILPFGTFYADKKWWKTHG
ncbi:MAG: DUF3817 domain-containing protein [Bacteroidota bacterium]|nr:DUF3817 domain-containing protein [Bacteroidota bacterium]MDX5430384.1 DUF3817 domain-containing protein [Bacteroidota bacterium]MDX5469145.1 DUF3817 domain-containing protein [Bacteroidota bacterium]